MFDFDRLAVLPSFAVFGEGAQYIPLAGPSVSCRVVRGGGGTPLKLGPITVYMSLLSFDVRAAEVPAPASGGVFQVGSTGYTVTGTPYHPEGDAHGHVWSCPVLWGTMVTYRTATGTQAMMNPPSGTDWMVAAPVAAGAVSISIKGTLVSGRLLPGDMLTVNGETYTITAAVSAVSGVFNNIPLDRPLVAAVALNTPVTFSYACDRPVLAGVAGYDASQLLGGIVVGNRRVILMQERLTAAGIPTPTTADSVLIEERWFRVRNAAATYQGNAPFVWDLQMGG